MDVPPPEHFETQMSVMEDTRCVVLWLVNLGGSGHLARRKLAVANDLQCDFQNFKCTALIPVQKLPCVQPNCMLKMSVQKAERPRHLPLQTGTFWVENLN